MATKRIFVSFDYTRDRDLKDNFVAQAKQQQLTVTIEDFSLEEDHRDPAWEQKAKQQIRRCSLVVVLLGEDTHNASGVRKEVDIARGFSKPIIQIQSKRAHAEVKGAGEVYPWKWEKLNPVLAS